MIVACDIDGILTNETNGHDYENRTPRLENIEKLNKLYYDGNYIYLFTSRFSIDENVTIKWLLKYNVKYHKIIFDKPQYDLFIDDKAITDFT